MDRQQFEYICELLVYIKDILASINCQLEDCAPLSQRRQQSLERYRIAYERQYSVSESCGEGKDEIDGALNGSAICKR